MTYLAGDDDGNFSRIFLETSFRQPCWLVSAFIAFALLCLPCLRDLRCDIIYVSSMAAYIERDERCLFIGNLDSRVTEEILWELFLQVPRFWKLLPCPSIYYFFKEIIRLKSRETCTVKRDVRDLLTIIYLVVFCFLIFRLVLWKLSTFLRTKKQADKKAMVSSVFRMKSLYLIPLV